MSNAKAGISIELTRPVVTMTYEQVVQLFRNVVNTQFPPELGGRIRHRRHINEMNGRGIRGRGRGGRRGRCGRGRRGQGGRGRPKRARDDSSYITLTNVRQI